MRPCGSRPTGARSSGEDGRSRARWVSPREPSGRQGFVLDPILSLRRSLALGPGERARVSLIVAAGESRQEVLSLMDKYGDPHAIDRAMDFAWASAQLELRLLRIQPDEARRFQEIASHLLFPNPLLRPPAERIEENRKGQAGLWPYGISGDVPIILVSIGEARDIGLVRQLLQAHSYWRMHGLKADLVILNEEASGYEQPLREQLEGLIRAHATNTATEQTGRIFLRSTDQLPEEDLSLLMAAARVVLVAARGTLPQQIGVAAEVPEPPEFLARKRAPRDPSAPLPFMELPYFNSLGGFTPDGREYAIYLGPDTHTPAPWVNVIANPTFGTLVSETGVGLHLVRQQPAQPPDGMVERSGDGSSVRGDVHPGRRDRCLLDDHPVADPRGVRLPGTARGGVHGLRAQQSWDRAGADGLRAGGRKRRRADQAAEAAVEE